MKQLTATDFSQLQNIDLSQFYKGIDVSHWNKSINWQQLQNRIDWCYIKLSDGIDPIDSFALAHAQGASSLLISFGYYHFCRPGGSPGDLNSIQIDAERQAAIVLTYLEDLFKTNNINPLLPLALDLEPTSKWDSNLIDPDEYEFWIKKFIDRVYDPIYNSKTVVIYSRKEYLERKLSDQHTLGNHPLWLSRYSDDYDDAETIKGWVDWDIWQFSETGLLLPDETGNSGEESFKKKDLDLWRISRFPIQITKRMQDAYLS